MNLYQRLLEIERRQTQIERYRAELGASILTASQNQFNMDSGTIASLANGDNGLVAPYDLVSSCEVRFVSTRVFTNYNLPPTGSTFLWNGEGGGYIYSTDNYNWMNVATLQSNVQLPYLFEWTALSYEGVQTQSGITSYKFSGFGNNRNSELYLKRNYDNSIRYLDASKINYDNINANYPSFDINNPFNIDSTLNYSIAISNYLLKGSVKTIYYKVDFYKNIVFYV